MDKNPPAYLRASTTFPRPRCRVPVNFNLSSVGPGQISAEMDFYLRWAPKKSLQVRPNDFDFCLFYSHYYFGKIKAAQTTRFQHYIYDTQPLSFNDRNDPKGIVAMQVDDTFIRRKDAFFRLEEKEVTLFVHKLHTILYPNSSLHFNGIHIRMDQTQSIFIGMTEHVTRMDTVCIGNYDTSQYMSARAKDAYAIAVSLPDMSFEYVRARKVQNPSNSDVRFSNRAILTLKRSQSMM